MIGIRPIFVSVESTTRSSPSPPFDDGHLHEHWRRVGDVAEAGLLWVQQFFGTVRLSDAGRDDADVAQFDVDRLLAFFVADVGVDRLLLVDDLAACSVEEGVERAVVVFGDPFFAKYSRETPSSSV